MNSKIRSRLSSAFIVLIAVSGLCLLLYPTVTDGLNKRKQLGRMETYDEAVQEMDEVDFEKLFSAAEKYNQQLRSLSAPLSQFDDVTGYDNLLNINGTGIMGYVTIPIINVRLPIYHGSSSEVLDVGAGHLQGSSLPIGGTDTHAVISAHTGLPSARLFTDIDRLTIGDTFSISVLDRELTYQVEEILIIEPSETQELDVISGGDYVTLMTCTPYGINSHRLLVRSKRVILPDEKNIKIFADAVKVDYLLTYTVIAVPMFIIILAVWMTVRRYNAKFQSDLEKRLNSYERNDD